MVFTEEVSNMQELAAKLSKVPNLSKIKIAVVMFIFDEKGKLILHRRGPGARDEVGKLQAIGGSVNGGDADFRDALKRELKEEAGDQAEISIDEFIGAQIDAKNDLHTGEFVSWVILAYKGTLQSGELINMEPDRCIGFEANFMEDFNEEDLSSTASNFIKYMLSKK